MSDLFANLNAVNIVLFCVGIVFLLIELFIPGFGIFGGLGLLSLVLCVVFLASNVLEGIILVLIIGAIVTVLALTLGRSLRKGFLYKSSLVLKNSETKDQGYVSNDDLIKMEGKTGVCLTTLRPAGMALIGGEKVDVVTDGEFLLRGTKIVVSKVVGRRIIVKEAEQQ